MAEGSKSSPTRDRVMQLSRMVPARRKTLKLTWIREGFSEMSPRWREIRKETKRGNVDTCFWCRYKFEDGDRLNLAGRERGLNVILCDNCAREAQETE